MVHVLLAAALVVAAGAAAPAAAEPSAEALERRRGEIARELLRVGQELRREIVTGDVRALGARIPAEGLRCAGRLVPRARVQRDLATPGSWLHDTILGAAGGHGTRLAPASLAELLRTEAEVAITVSFVRDERAGPLGRPCVEFRARDVVTPVAPLCFEQRDGRWWFTESLYPCG